MTKPHRTLTTLASCLLLSATLAACSSSNDGASKPTATEHMAAQTKASSPVNATQPVKAPQVAAAKPHSHHSDFASYELAYKEAQAQGYELDSNFTPYRGFP